MGWQGWKPRDKPEGPRRLNRDNGPRNRLVTAETENVPIRDGRSRDPALTLLHLATNRLIIGYQSSQVPALQERGAITIEKGKLRYITFLREKETQ